MSLTTQPATPLTTRVDEVTRTIRATRAASPRRTALVTGGARGIGLAVVRRLAQDGYRIAFSYRADRAAADALSAELNAHDVEHAMFHADLCDREAVRDLPQQVAARFGGLDVLINNAGITDDGAFLAMDPARYRRVIATNLSGTLRLTGAALPLLRRGVQPAVVTVSSLGGIAGKEGQVAYAASKGALIGMTQWLARRYRETGIRFNAVAPGFIRTDMTADLAPGMIAPVVDGSALRRVGEDHEVADAIAFLLSPGYLQASTLRLDGGFHR